MSRRYGYGSRFDYGYYPERRARRQSEARGIKVGKIGATWWGQRWIEALERASSGYGNRLPRGRTYARAGAVHDLEIQGGKVQAKVTGSRPRPYVVQITLPVLSEQAWQGAIAAMAARAVFAAELLTGQMPRAIDEAFSAGGTSLFPMRSKDLVTECSCPDDANPCKHVAAVHYVLGEAFDQDPFLLFELRGRKRGDVLEALRQRRSGEDEVAGANAPKAKGRKSKTAAVAPASEAPSLAAPADYDRPAQELAGMQFQIVAPPTLAGTLVQLGAPPSWPGSRTPAQALVPIYAAMSAFAIRLAEAPDPD